MKIKLYSLLVSIIFIPVSILSQWIGLYLGKILYFIYDKFMGLRLPDIINDTGPTVLSGLFAAYVSALAVTKIYKNYNLLFVSILPFAVIAFAFIGDISIATKSNWSSESIGMLIREIVTIGAYYYFLKDGILKKE
jgi:hypothetical protein|tara:strand:+ start:138 stop:545 length:408 start_codon:yes stop_codon:yes gene_type:complete